MLEAYMLGYMSKSANTTGDVPSSALKPVSALGVLFNTKHTQQQQALQKAPAFRDQYDQIHPSQEAATGEAPTAASQQPPVATQTWAGNAAKTIASNRRQLNNEIYAN